MKSLCVVNSLPSSKTLRNRTAYYKQYGRVLWVEVHLATSSGLWCAMCPSWELGSSKASHMKASQSPEQLPCRSADVKIFYVFLCQRCREVWREILVKFSVLRFPGFGCATEKFTKISCQKRCEKRKISRKFHSAGAALIFCVLVSAFCTSGAHAQGYCKRGSVDQRKSRQN